MNIKPADTGVIIGRFQVARIKGGHELLLDQISQAHQRVVVLLGCTPALGDKRNPLDFPTRQRMIQEHLPRAVVLPLMDHPDDDQWSRNVDAMIGAAFPLGSVVIYGGRKSFIPYYSGVHNTSELPAAPAYSGTQIRADIARGVLTTEQARRGAVYATLNNYPRAFMTVDVAIFDDVGNVYLGSKPGEIGWRFPGGFVNPGEALEAAARREAQEETGLTVDGLQYVGSAPIVDWRYSGEDRITTALFTSVRQFGKAEAGDDLAELESFDYGTLCSEILVPAHRPLLEMLHAASAAHG